MKTYTFSDQLEIGRQGERFLDQLLEPTWIVTPSTYNQQRQGIDRILTHRQTGQKVRAEYKTDYRGHRSERAFVEIISVDRKGKLGWAYLSEADFLIYYLCKLNVVYVIHFQELRQHLRRWHRLYELVSVANPDYQTHGLLVPLCEFEEIAREVIFC